MRKLLIGIMFCLISLQLIAGGENKSIISLGPVPLSGSVLTVKLLNPSVQVSSIELRNLIGRKLQEKKFPTGGEFVVFTDMESYPNGLYVVITKDNFGKIIESTKFIINK